MDNSDEALRRANEALWDLAPIKQLLSGCSLRQITGIDGRTIFALGSDGGAGQVTFPVTLPWTVYSFKNSSNQLFVGVLASDALLYGKLADSTSGITLAAAGSLLDETNQSDSGWIPCALDDSVWLEVKITSGEVDASPPKICTSMSLGASGQAYVGGQWVDGGDIQNDGGTPPSQTYARKKIAEASGGVVTNIAITDLVIAEMAIAGTGAIYFASNA